MAFGEFEALANFFDVVGVEVREGFFIDAVDQALAYSKVDSARALLKVYDPPEKECIGFPLRFLKRNVEGGEALEILEDDARDVVDEFPITFAIDLLRTGTSPEIRPRSGVQFRGLVSRRPISLRRFPSAEGRLQVSTDGAFLSARARTGRERAPAIITGL